MMPANSRRPMIPMILRTATPRIAAAARVSAPEVTDPRWKLGRTTRSVMPPMT